MTIAFAADHAGFEYKVQLTEIVKNLKHEVMDFGAFSSEPVDYPDYAFPASKAVAEGKADFGIIICGTGIGMAITANKVSGIRAANCCSVKMAQMAREHNNANILALGARLIDIKLAARIIKTFLKTEFQGGRHQRRLEKIES